MRIRLLRRDVRRVLLSSAFLLSMGAIAACDSESEDEETSADEGSEADDHGDEDHGHDDHGHGHDEGGESPMPTGAECPDGSTLTYTNFGQQFFSDHHAAAAAVPRGEWTETVG